MLESLRTFGEYTLFQDDEEDEIQLIELRDESGNLLKVINYNPDTYDWDKHSNDMEKINYKLMIGEILTIQDRETL